MTAARVLLALTGALLAWALFFGGGDSPAKLAWIGGAALSLAALVAAAALDRRVARPQVGRPGVAFLVCFAALVVWQGVSIAWSVQPDRSWDYFNRGLAYLAFLVLGLFVGALVPRATRSVAAALGVLFALTLSYALLAKGIPSLYPDYGRLARLRSPVGYWNAFALVSDFALVLGLWRAAQRRVDGVLLVFLATVTVLLAYSRGGVVIGLLIAVTWLVLGRRRLESLVSLALGGGAGAAVVGIALGLHGVTDDNRPRPERVHDGRLFLLALVIATALVFVFGRLVLRVELRPETRRRATVALLAVIALGCAGSFAGVLLHGGRATDTTPYCTQSASRLACGSSDARLDWWKEAWQSFEDKPLGGTGAASFELSHRLRRSQYTPPVTEPHGFAVQQLGETGVVGFLLLVGAAVFATVAVRRRLGDDAAVALALCALAYLLNILIDIGYDFVAVSAPFFTLLGVLLADSRPPAGQREPMWAFGVLLLAATAVLSLAAPYVAQRKVDEAAATGNPRLAAQAHKWNPLSVTPLLTEAAIEEGLGHELNALQLYRRAVDTQPDNPDARVELGRFELYVRKDPCAAYRELNDAYTLDHFNRVISVPGGPLDVARAKVNAGACE